MPRSSLLRALAASFLLIPLATAEDFGVRIVFGDDDSQPASYDGSLSLRNGGTVRQLEGWRFDADDSIDGLSWKLSMHPMRVRAAAKKGRVPVVGNGVIAQITGATGSSELDVRTSQGNFTLRLADMPFGKPARPMNGRALVERIPSTSALDRSPDEDDYPVAAAAANGDVWIAYVRFQHHPDHDRLRANKDSAPADFNESLSAPGGDQLLARRGR